MDGTLFRALFAPRGVALYGASGDAAKNTARPQRYLRKHGYAGTIAPINRTRREVLGDMRFYLMLPAILAPGFIVTGFFFHQGHLVQTKGWTMPWFASCFVAFAAAQLPASLIAGPLVDRFGALPEPAQALAREPAWGRVQVPAEPQAEAPSAARSSSARKQAPCFYPGHRSPSR